jgi:hypothetical protein
VLSYNLLSELPLKHKSYNHNSFLSELLSIITPINTSSITRTRQTKHIKNKAITVAKALKKVSETAITLKTVTVSKKVKTAADMIYQHVRRSVIFVISQAIS